MDINVVSDCVELYKMIVVLFEINSMIKYKK